MPRSRPWTWWCSAYILRIGRFVQQVIDRASQTGTDFEHEYRLLLPDGRVKHVHAIAHALQDASGNREFIGAVTDITERKTAEEKIRCNEKRASDPH